MPYEVNLQVFQGPIDLLLHLITRQRVDIYDISIAEITEEYLAAVEAMEELDLEVATGFLVVAATLLELKSARLLPGRRFDDADGRLLEERDLLLARLVECSTFRNAGTALAEALKHGEQLHPRLAGLEPHYLELAPDLLARVELDDIARAAARALMPRPLPTLDMSHVAPIKASVKDAIIELADQLRTHNERSFTQLTAGRTQRIDIVVRFLALLELYKAGAVDLTQSGRFAEIVARWTGEVDAHDAVAEAEEYAIDTEAGGSA
jgi:segregation and condensation protein A